MHDKREIYRAILNPKREQLFFVGTVTGTEPLQVRLDGDTADVPATNTSGGFFAAEGDRVVLLKYGKQFLCLGVINGVLGGGADFEAHLADTVKNNVHGLKTAGSINIYVDATIGNDANPGTQSQPLKTIGAAVGKITSLIIDVDHTVTIRLAPGTYVENVRITNLHGAGVFYLRGGSNLEEADSYIIDGWVGVTGCTCTTYIYGIKVLGSSNQEGEISFSRCLAGRVSFCKVDRTGRINSTNNYGINAGTYSLVLATNNDISNITGGRGINVAIQCFETSRVHSLNNTGSNNSVGLRAVAGTIMKSGSQPSGTTAEVAGSGGVIR